MIDIHDIYNKIDSPATYYILGMLTGGLIATVGIFFHNEYGKYKKAVKDKSKKNLEESLRNK